MKRLLANTACALSLALFLLSVAFWVRSNFRWDISQWRFHSATGRTYVDLLSTCNVLQVAWASGRLDPPSAATPQNIRLVFGEPVRQGVWWHSQPIRQWHPFPWRTLGFSGTAGRSHATYPQIPATVHGTNVAVTLPYRSLALVTGVLPAVRLRRWLRSRKRPPGTCRRCGYDLRATQGQCPECGQIPAGAVS